MTDYSKLSDDEIKTAARKIMRSSPNDVELRRRLKDELGYPYYASIARLSGMIMVMMWSPRGSIINL